MQAALCLLALLAPAVQDEGGGPDLAARRAAKLALPVFAAAGFVTDFAAARARAAASGKPIFAYFTRSHSRCPPCETLEAGVLASAAFVEFAREVVTFLHCASRVPDEPHADLPAEKGFDSVPALAFLDADGTVLARVDVEQRSVAAFRAILAGVQEYRALCTALAEDGGEPDLHQRAELLLAEARLRRWSFAELDARLQAFGKDLPAEHRAALAPLRSELEFDWLVRLTDITPKEKAARLKVFVREKRVPKGRRELSFWLEYGAVGTALEDPVILDTAAEALTGLADAPAGMAERHRRKAEEIRRR